MASVHQKHPLAKVAVSVAPDGKVLSFGADVLVFSISVLLLLLSGDLDDDEFCAQEQNAVVAIIRRLDILFILLACFYCINFV
jgi:hypothetical protein